MLRLFAQPGIEQVRDSAIYFIVPSLGHLRSRTPSTREVLRA